jgi:uncharacterized protein
MRRMKRNNIYQITLVVLICTITSIQVYSQKLPDKPVPPRLVNDFAKMLSSEEVNRLEQKLVAFNDSTSTQIAIVTVPTLDGYAPSDYAQRLGEKWGIGQKGKNNGVLILVKPKTADSKGEVRIETGYGAEGAIPDLVCGEIVDYEVIPAFRNGDYYGGLNKAVNTLMSLARGEFSAADYGQKVHRSSKSKGAPIGLIIFIVFIVIAMMSRNSGNSNNKHIGTGGLPFWLLMGMMGSGRGSSGSWGGFSGGSGGGGGGGFGGFGGGSFGGGGAGGSW